MSAKKTLTKRDLVLTIAEENMMRQEDVFTVVQQTLDIIIDALAQGKHVEFREFGVFEIVRRKERIGRNPNRPEDVVCIPERNVVKFKPGKRMREITK